MDTIGKRIRERRIELGMTQDTLARLIGYKDRNSICKIEVGARDITQSKIKAIADALRVSPSYIMGWRDADGNIIEDEPKYTKIPVLGEVRAGLPMEAVENIIDYEEIPTEWQNGNREYFALRIKGQSMEPRLYDGDIVIVRKQSTIENGEVAVVLVNGEDATIKKVKLENGSLSLIPLNPVFPTLMYPAEAISALPVQIIGRVVELRAKI